MKKYLTVLALLISFFVNAQDTPGNLQFNRVVTFSQTSGVPSNTTVVFESITIPEGKVWKIQSVALAGSNGTTVFPFTAGSGSQIKWLYARFNNIIAFTGNNLGDQYSLLPIWLNSGTYNFRVNSANSNQTGSVMASYSAIEFNIIPQ